MSTVKQYQHGTYLVTGGAGFIGSNIVERLVKNGERVKVIDNLIAGKRENLAGIMEKIEFIEGDIRDDNDMKKAIKGVDFVLHQAALRSVPKSVDDPLPYTDVNVTGTLKLLLAAKEEGVKRLVLASSSSVYGEREEMPEREEDMPQPISPYAATKLTGEYYCQVFSSVYGLETVSLRYFNVFGPRQDPGSEYAVVIPKFILSMLKDEPSPIHGDGKQSRDFTYVDDVVEANILAAQTKGVSGEVFNIACNEGHTVLEIADGLNRILSKSIKPVFTPPRKGDVLHTLADISKAKKLLGYAPRVAFEEGLEKTVSWFKG